jgi:hypothetical protein
MLIISNCWHIDNQFVIFEEDENENENENEDDYDWSAILMISSYIKCEFLNNHEKGVCSNDWRHLMKRFVWNDMNSTFMKIIDTNHLCKSFLHIFRQMLH